MIDLQTTNLVIDVTLPVEPVEITVNAGPAGRGVASMAIEDDDLVATYTNGQAQNLGRVVGNDGVSFTDAAIIDTDLVIYRSVGEPINLGRVVGNDGNDGRGIASITQPSGPGTAQINYTDGDPDVLTLPQGEPGIDGDRYKTTSNTSLTVPHVNAQVSLTVGLNLAYSAGQEVVVANDGVASFIATVDDYNTSTGLLTVTCVKKHGLGTYNTWSVNLSGAPGADGTDGRGITDITQPSGNGTALISYTDGSTSTINLPVAPNSLAFLSTDIQVAEHFVAGRTAPGWVFGDAPGGTSIISAQATGLYGAVQIGTGTGGTGQATAYSGQTSAQTFQANISLSGIDHLSMSAYVRPNTLPTNAVNALLIIGFGSTINADVAAIVFEYTSVAGQVFWRCRCTNSSTSTTVTTSVQVVNGSDYRLTFKATSSSVTFYINGTLVATINTNIPATSTFVAPIVIARRTAGSGTNNAIILDSYSYRILTNRTPFVWPS